MQQSLALTRPAPAIPRLASPTKLSDMAANSSPTDDLSLVLARHATTLMVSAVPLEPATRIVGMYPSLGSPDAERLAGVDTEAVK
ncbi:hypothetical protein ATY30_14220 [Sinorhizobium americanum]|nr:hypothetical protein ATY30_14220 [Sinorhizobium americanum]